MTENTKRTIFNSNNPSNNIKINVEANLSYNNEIEKEKKDVKNHSKNFSPSNNNNKVSNKNINNNNQEEKNIIKKRDVHTPTNSKLKKNNNKFQSPNVLSASQTINTTKIIKKTSSKKNKNNINNNIKTNNIKSTNSNKISSNNDKILNSDNNNNNNNDNISINEVNIQDTSQIDSILLSEPQKIDEKFLNFFKKLQENNPLEKLNSFQNDTKLFKNYTMKIIEAFFDYQKEYYSLLKQTINLNSKLKNLLVKNNEKFRKIVKKQHRLDELLEKNNLKKKIYVNVNKKDDDHLNDLLPMKKNELDVYKTIFSVKINEKDIQNERQKIINEKNFKENEEKTFNFLKYVFLNIKEKVTKNNLNEEDFINKLNLDEKEKNLLTKVLNENKENKNEEKKEKIFYVISNKRDDNDDKLENFLKTFYSKRNVPKISFKKLSNNNYEYGTEKIMVKFESDLIRVRYSGGYILLDKFLEVNGPIEEKKLKAKSAKKNKINIVNKKK